MSDSRPTRYRSASDVRAKFLARSLPAGSRHRACRVSLPDRCFTLRIELTMTSTHSDPTADAGGCSLSRGELRFHPAVDIDPPEANMPTDTKASRADTVIPPAVDGCQWHREVIRKLLGGQQPVDGFHGRNAASPPCHQNVTPMPLPNWRVLEKGSGNSVDRVGSGSRTSSPPGDQPRIPSTRITAVAAVCTGPTGPDRVFAGSSVSRDRRCEPS